MCGIVGQFGRVDADAGRRMLARLRHRGPDDEGTVELEGAWLGHRRLSIVDVDGGAQPLASSSGELLLVGNGEVYNHEAIRRTLADPAMRTESDNEVALQLVAERGPGALGELLGMFAFLIAGRDGTFVAARDPVGIKPLYWARREETVVFASELGAYDPEWQAAAEAFPPGHYWTPSGGLRRFAAAVGVNGHQRFEGPPGPDATVPMRMLVEVRDRLIRTVERQMMGDVPVGVFLSGGLDSSIVAAIAVRHARRTGAGLTVPTFAVGLRGSPDLAAARRVAAYLGTAHREHVYTADDALQALPEVVRAIESFDPSLVRSAVPNFFLAELASRHVKVVLTGEGADEIFAGYEYLCRFQEEDLHAELVRTIEGLHNLNLQRADRVTMAHGLEARVPFLERDMIELGLALPVGWKLAGPGRQEKRVLREAFRGWLPDEVLWRDKAQFGDGSGAASVLKQVIADSVTETELEEARDLVEPPLRTREELAYYRMFASHLPAVEPRGTVGRFATA